MTDRNRPDSVRAEREGGRERKMSGIEMEKREREREAGVR